MARRSLWCLAALVLALLFVTANGLRGPASQVEGHETRTTPRSRGGSRFNPKASEGLESSTTTPFSSPSSGPTRARNGRRGGSRTAETARPEASTLKSRLDPDRDIKLSAGNAKKPLGSSNFERRRTSAARNPTTEIPHQESVVVAPTPGVRNKAIKTERESESHKAKDNNDGPRKIGLFRTRHGPSGRRGSITTTTTTTEKSSSSQVIRDSGNIGEFDTTGPSVFSGTTEVPRSRTGRKIQTTLSPRDLKSGLPSSRRFASASVKKPSGPEVDEFPTSFDATSRAQRRSDDFSVTRRHDIVPSGSESVNIDVPLIPERRTRSRTEDAAANSPTARKPVTSGGAGNRRGRGRSAEEKTTESTTSGARSGSRRGSSRFSEAAPSSNNSLEKASRSRSDASRTRTRSQDSSLNKSSARSELSARNSDRKESAGRRDRIAGTRATPVPSTKSPDSEARGRSRVKSRTTGSPLNSAATTEDSTISGIVPAESSRASTQVPFTSTSTLPATTPNAVTERNRGRTTTTQKAPKEDFFNHGLGFRGRKFATEAPTQSTNQQNQNATKTEVPRRGNPGWTLKRRPGYRPEDVEVTSSESPSATTESATAATISNEIPTASDSAKLTTTTVSSSLESTTNIRGSKRPAEGGERGGKTFKKTSSSGSNKASKDPEEGDNYPPEFKARLAQLKNGKEQEATPKPSLGGLFKKRPTTDPQYVTRSRQKLDNAVKLTLKPEPTDDKNLNRKGNNKSFTSSTVASIAKKKRLEVARRPSLKPAGTTTLKTLQEINKNSSKFGKLARANKVRKSDEEEIDATTRSELDETNDLFESTTLPYSKENRYEKKRDRPTHPTKSPILSRRAKELPREGISTTTRRTRLWYAPHLDKNFEEPTPRSRKPGASSTRRPAGSTTTTKRTRAWNTAYIDRNWQEPTRRSTIVAASSTAETSGSSTTSRPKPEVDASSTTAEYPLEVVSTGSRYTRKKTETFKPFESGPQSSTTEDPAHSPRRREFRPRTATYRRHSELPPPVAVVNALPVDKSPSINSIAITPKAPVKFHASVRGSAEDSTQRLARQEPTLNVQISGESENATTSSSNGGSNSSSGIVGSSNGASGAANSNIFSPTRSTFLLNSNATLFDQLRSTVAPLLNALGNRTPIFSTAYSKVDNSSSGSRVTPSGAPPRFSARYKGAELFVRRPNVLEPAAPSITSSTTPFTPTENSGSAPPITVESPGEPRVITFYQALESASISNELVQTDAQQQQSFAQVDARNATDNDSNDTINANNDTITTIPTAQIIETTLDSITMEIGTTITTVETTQLPETTPRQDSATQIPEVITVLPETTETSATSATTSVSVEENPPSTPLTSATSTPEVSTQSDSTTPEVTTESSTTTGSVTERLSIQREFSEANASFQMTAIPSVTGRIVYANVDEGFSTTTEQQQVGDETTTIIAESGAEDAATTAAAPAIPSATGRIVYSNVNNSLSVTTEQSVGDETTTMTVARVAEDAATTAAATTEQIVESTTLEIAKSGEDLSTIAPPELDMITTVQPTTEIPSTTIAPTMEIVTILPEKPEVTTQIASEITTNIEISTTTDLPSNLEVVVETATSIPQLTIPASELTTPMTASTEDNQPTTTGSLEIIAQFGESTTMLQVTDEAETESTSTVLSSTVSDSLDTEVPTSTELLPELRSTESSVRSEIMLDRIAANLGNDTDLPNLSDNNLLSRMMIRLMTALFPNSSEESISSSSDNPPAQSSEALNNTQQVTNSSGAEDEMPQLLGGFLDNTDGKNATADVESNANSPTTQMNLEATTSSPEITSTQVTTAPTTPVTLSRLEETTLTPRVTVPADVEQTEIVSAAPEDLATTPAVDETNVTTNQPSETTTLTPPGAVENEVDSTSRVPDGDFAITRVTTGDNGETSTNNNSVPEMTTMIPETRPDPLIDTPNSLAGFQDTTTATAQRTAGDDAQATSQPDQTTVSLTTPISTPETTTMQSSSPSSSSSTTTVISLETDRPDAVATDAPSRQTTLAETTTATMEMTTATMETTTATVEMTTATMETTLPMASENVTVAAIPEATTAASTTTSTESSAPTTQISSMVMNVTDNVDNAATATTTTTTTTTPTPPTTTTTTTTTTTAATTQYLGRFGASRITPAPRFSVSSSTKTPLRDYLVYGIFPNKTIVRKRPEDNLIDARNVDSPYVIFGIFPDGRLVRKFPNGTVIPDPPTNPVEVVFSLSTTTSTTNRPSPVFTDNRQSNYYYNQNAAIYNNRAQSILASSGGQPGGFPGQVDLGLSGNAILSGPNGEAPNSIASQLSGTKMSDLLLNTQMGTAANAASEIGGLLTTTTPASSSIFSGPPATATAPNVNPQGGRIIQDRERDEASRSREAGGQRSTVYIGQEKFINYWSDGNTANNNSRLVSVKINSVASSLNEGPASNSATNQSAGAFNILPNNNSNGDQATAPPGFPWKDPLDQIFGITTESQVITASVASNTLEDSIPSRSPVPTVVTNPLVEVFNRLLNRPGLSTSTSAPVRITTTTTTAAPTTTTTTTTTTTPAPTTTTTTTTTPAPTTTTTTTTTPAPTTTTTTTTTTTPPPTTTTTTTTTPAPTTTNLPMQTPFGSTFDDLAFLNSLLQTRSSGSSTPKTLTEVEQLLANKILSLALGKPGPTRSPKAIQSVNVSPNSIFSDSTPGPSSRPIIIDLLQSSTTTTTQRAQPPSTEQVTWRPVTTVSPTTTTSKPPEPPTTTTVRPTTTTTSPPPITTSTTPKSVVITARTVTTPRPRPTTTKPPAQGFGASILQALFGGNIFGGSTTQRPVQATRRPVQTTPRLVATTPKPVATTQKPVSTTTAPLLTTPSTQPPSNQEIHVTPRRVETSQYKSNTPNSLGMGSQSIFSTSTMRTSTYSAAEDAKFLAALLKVVGQPAPATSAPPQTSESLSNDDEAFLRAILNGQANVKPAAGETAAGLSDAALLAALLKAQGIEPSTPANRLREQLQAANTKSPTTQRPRILATTTKRPAPTRPRTQQQVTWSPSSTYPPPLFSNFGNFGSAPQSPRGTGTGDASAGDNNVRSQVFNAAIGATRAFSQFLGAAITGAAQQLQSFVRNGTRYVSEVVG